MGSAGLTVGSGCCDNLATERPQTGSCYPIILRVHTIGLSGMEQLSISEPAEIARRDGVL